MSASAPRVAGVSGLVTTDLIGGGVVLLFLLTTAVPYFALALGGSFIAGDARQQVWTLWTLLDPGYFPPDLFASYMIDKTMPDAFVWLVEKLARIAGAPEPVFAWIGVSSLIATGILAWLCGRATAGAAGSWAALLLVFAIDTVADRTAGGLPRALGMPIVMLAVFGFVSLRPIVIGIACILGGLLWYPAGVIAGALFFAHLMAPAAWFGRTHARSWLIRAAFVAAVGAATVLPVLPDVVMPSSYGKLISASDPDWPEAGEGGRFTRDQLLGAVDVMQPAHILVARAAGTLSSRAGSWWRLAIDEPRVSRAFGLAFFAAIVIALLWRMRSDIVARRVLAVFGTGLVLYSGAYAVAPMLYIPERYLSYTFAAFALVAAPYIFTVTATRWAAHRTGVSPSIGVAVATAALVVLAGGRLTTQGLGIQPDASEQEVLRFLKERTRTGSLIAGWPTGMIEDVPYFAHRPVLLAHEMHLPWHDRYAREMRERTQVLIDAWHSADLEAIEALHSRYSVDYFIVDKALLSQGASYFVPFDRGVAQARQALGDRASFLAHPDPSMIVYENADYRVLAIGDRT